MMTQVLKQAGKLCTGCGACYNACPVDAITMEADDEGFLYPHVDEWKCIQCGKCTQICPKLHAYWDNAAEPACYAARANDEIRVQSSSGGMFTVLAEYVLGLGGVVCGVAMEQDYSVHHIIIEDAAQLDRLRKSKYVQSNTELVYRELQKIQKQGRYILFTGCPCQVAAARNYLGNDEKVFYVDLLCHGVPSVQMFQDYMQENFDLDKVETIEFRNKLNGWRAEQLRIFWKDGSSERITWGESAYEEGFQRNITLRDGCEECEFAGQQRQGDMTIGDFWRVEEYDAGLNDKKGTSVVLVNNEHGRQLLEQIQGKLLDLQETPIQAARYNRLKTTFQAHPNKARFKKLYRTHSFTESVFQTRHALYDIGLVGIYTVGNYGGQLTQYALYSTLTDLGYSVLMIAQPLDSSYRPNPKGAHLFEKEPYEKWDKSRYFPNLAEMKFLNQQCKVFVTGSDQMFNNNLYNEFRGYMVQNFVTDNHCKIAYAASFGHDRIWGGERDRATESYFMNRFDFFSVREESAVRLCREEFDGRSAEWVLDPVFLCPKERYNKLIEIGNKYIPMRPYLFAYILDPSADKEKILRTYADGKNLVVRAISDRFRSDEDIKECWNIDTLSKAPIECWVAHIAHCDFMITDSYHGMCLAIIHHKPFVVIVNKLRGETRFLSVLHLLHLESRMVYSIEEFERKMSNLPEIDWDMVEDILQREREHSLEWLCNAVECGKRMKKPYSVFDLADARIDELWKRTDMQMDALRKEMQEMKNSYSWRIGRIATWLPRKVRKMVKRRMNEFKRAYFNKENVKNSQKY